MNFTSIMEVKPSLGWGKQVHSNFILDEFKVLTVIYIYKKIKHLMLKEDSIIIEEVIGKFFVIFYVWHN